MFIEGDTYLAETSASGEAGAVRALHETSGRNALTRAIGGPDADVAMALWWVVSFCSRTRCDSFRMSLDVRKNEATEQMPGIHSPCIMIPRMTRSSTPSFAASRMATLIRPTSSAVLPVERMEFLFFSNRASKVPTQVFMAGKFCHGPEYFVGAARMLTSAVALLGRVSTLPLVKLDGTAAARERGIAARRPRIVTLESMVRG